VVDIPLITSSRDPLSQPTRARLFELLGDLDRPSGTAELAASLELHPNGVRAHLRRMERDGLVVRRRDRRAQGRPRDTWTLAPDARPGGRPPRAYGELVRWLARAMRSDPEGKRQVEQAGRKIGREIAPRAGTVDDGTFELVLRRLGFQPEVQSRTAEELTVCLGNCPYRDAVRESQIVCILHRGITRGLLDKLDRRAVLEDFVAKDPDEAGCQIAVSGLRSGPAPT
jgi:predicted ArsR family transcriptional regulator